MFKIKYLNRADKRSIQILGGFVTYMQDLAETWEQCNKGKELLKSIRTSKTWAFKAMQGLLKGVDPKEVAKVMMETKATEIVAKYKDSAVREYERMKKLDSVTPVETNDLFNIVDLTLAGYCRSCTNTGEQADNCHIRGLFIKYDIPPAKLEVAKGECPYQLEVQKHGGGVSDAKKAG